MSLSGEVQELEKEKALLTNMLQSVDKEEEYLKRRLGLLEEKLAVQELKIKIKSRRAVVDQLKSSVSDLEKKLEESKKRLEAPPSSRLEDAKEAEESEDERPTQMMVAR